MTWKEFKEQVETQGVKDDTEISYIDVSGFCGVVDVDIDLEDGVVCIY